MAQAKTASKAFNIGRVKKMLHHFESYNFIKVVSNQDVEFCCLTENLKEFVRKEWLLTNLVASDPPAFLFKENSKNYKTFLEDVQSLVNTVPFSLIEIKNSAYKKENNTKSELINVMDLLKNQFKKQSGTILSNQTFCSPADAVELFNKKQRERKNWWRKFSALPGRFISSNVSNTGNDKSAKYQCEIQAEFPWGVETVETIQYLPNFSAEKEVIEVNISKRKKCIPHVVSCEANLDIMTFTYLCDSYENLLGKGSREVLRLNKKFAPFKLSIAGTGSSSEIVKGLEEVSLLLAKQVRKLGFSVLLLSNTYTTSKEQQLLRNDALGVPYTLLLNDQTLKIGTVALRSRDTMLEEDSHVSLITEYLGKLLK